MKLPTVIQKAWTNHSLPVIIFLVIGGWLLLSDLGDDYLWQDEAQTALISQTILDHGVPKAHDGKNSFSQEEGHDYGKNGLWKWHTWAQFYAVAPVFALFGESTFTARLPFATAGLGSLLLIYFLTLQWFRDQKTAFTAASFLLLSVPFLLLTTQCRYYGLGIFFTLSGFYGFARMTGQKPYGLPVLLVSALLLFHAHYIYYATLTASIVIYTLICERKNWKPVIFGLGTVSLINIPAAIWHSGIEKGYNRDFWNWEAFSTFFRSYAMDFHNTIFPFSLLLVAGILAIWGWKRMQASNHEMANPSKVLLLPLLFLGISLIALSFGPPHHYFRYLGPLIPFFFIILAYMVRLASKLHFLAAVAIFGIWVSTGDLKKYVDSLNHDYKGPMEGICAFLNQYAAPSDTVAIPYGAMPVKFYTDLHVIGALSEKDYKPVAAKADWIVMRANSVMKADAAMKKYIVEHMDKSRYRKAELDFPDIPYQNREAPDLHHFKTVTKAPKIQILKRVKPKQ